VAGSLTSSRTTSRWQHRLINGASSSINELTDAERINASYVNRVLRMTYLSPAIVEAILDGQFPTYLTMNNLMEPFPMD
jgi:hypothetical protein